jgi:uncharacterized protein YbjT (DUF2867 family)
MAKILITGATSNVGRDLVPLLQKKGVDFLAGSTKGQDINGIKGVVIDFLDTKTLKAAFKNIQTLFVVFPPLDHRTFEMAENLITEAKAAGIKHLIRLTGAGSDANSENLQGRQHGVIDKMIMDSGIPYTFLEAMLMMQDYYTWSKDMITGGTYYSSQLKAPHAMIDARDIAYVAEEVILHPEKHMGKAYLLTGPAVVTDEEAVKLIGKTLGKEINIVGIPEEAAKEAMKNMGFHPTIVENFSSMNVAGVSGFYKEVTDNVKKITGRYPRSMEDFVKAHIDKWK